MTSSFDTICSNTLEEVEMIAGDYKEFIYTVYTSTGTAVDLHGADMSLFLFRYGDPSSIILELEGVYTGSPINQFKVIIPSSSSIDLSGVYQQQPRITYSSASVIYHSGQGKVVIFPSPSL